VQEKKTGIGGATVSSEKLGNMSIKLYEGRDEYKFFQSIIKEGTRKRRGKGKRLGRRTNFNGCRGEGGNKTFNWERRRHHRGIRGLT